MITKLHVDGFRSLSRFEITIQPGLNILVGPNGSGKTNIISFFQFLSNLINRTLSEAISMSGGVAAVLEKIGQIKFRQEMTTIIYGSTLIPENDKNKPTYSFQYRYLFSILASDDLDAVTFSRQDFKLIRTDPKNPLPQYELEDEDTAWDFHVTQMTTPTGQFVTNIKKIDIDKFSSRFVQTGTPQANSLEQIDRLISSLDNSTSLVTSLSVLFQEIIFIRSDLIGGEIFNIVPSRVKQPEDSARLPGIQNDGSGLAASLFFLSKPRPKFSEPRWYMPYGYQYGYQYGGTFFDPNVDREAIFRQIEGYVRLVNPSIAQISVRNDPLDNQLKLSANIIGETGQITLPVSAMSDGTIKWLALITAILTHKTVFAIEEPENFLHPLMQREIVNIMREASQQRRRNSFVIMSTHSETLLNAAQPEEVLVVSMTNGITRAARPVDESMLRAQIQETGFGLGYFYVTGALTDD